MMFLWIILLGAVLYFAFRNQGQKLSAWGWGIGAAVLALPLVGMLFMHGLGGWGPGFGGRGGMMGPGRGYSPYGGMMDPRQGQGPGRGMMGPRQGFGRPGPFQQGPWARICVAVILVVVVVGLALLAYYAYKRYKAVPSAPTTPAPLPGDDQALAELRIRLAKGEIDAEQFDRLRQKLSE